MIFVTNQLQLHEMGVNLKLFKRVWVKQPSRLLEIEKDHFEPQIVSKCQTNVIGMEDKILSLYAKGLSTRDISKTLEEIYGFETSHETISAVTDKVIPLIQE